METEEQRRARLQQAYQTYTGTPYAPPTLDQAQANAAAFPELPQAGADTSFLEQAASAGQMQGGQQPAPPVDPGFAVQPEPPVMQAEPAPTMPPPPQERVVSVPQQDIVASGDLLADWEQHGGLSPEFDKLPPEQREFFGRMSRRQRMVDLLAAGWKVQLADGSYLTPDDPRAVQLAQANDRVSASLNIKGHSPSAQDVARAGERYAAAYKPSLLTEQSAMATQSRDAAGQAQSLVDAGIETQAQLIEKLGAQKSSQAAQSAELARQQQAELERIGEEMEGKRRVREAVVIDLEKQYRDLNEKASKIEIRDRRSTTRKVMGALAIGLGQMTDQNNLVAGLMQGMNVQTDNAGQISSMINASIERDLEMQRANLANARASSAAKFSELGVAQDAVKDVDAQHILAKAAIADKYALSLDALSKQGLSEQTTTIAATEATRLRTESAAAKAAVLQQQAAKDEDRLWALQVQREQERKAAAAAAARGKANQPQMVAELLAKEQAGTLTDVEMDKLNKLRKGNAEARGAEAEVAAGPSKGKMSDGDKKLARMASGVQPAFEHLVPYLDKRKDIPYFGVRGVTKQDSLIESLTPNAFIPDENILFRNSLNALTNVLLRDESGANLPDTEIATKKRTWGIEAGSDKIGKEGLRRMLLEFEARRRNGTLPPDIDEQPVE